MKVKMYTDGACKGNPGPGGWGAYLIYGDVTKDFFGGHKETTNNQMELTAAIEGLKALSRRCEVDLYTDSTYVMKGITEWIHGWKAKGWKNSQRKPVKNAELWKALDDITQQHDVKWHWVKGHAGDPGNEQADYLANKGVDQILNS